MAGPRAPERDEHRQLRGPWGGRARAAPGLSAWLTAGRLIRNGMRRERKRSEAECIEFDPFSNN